MSAFTFDTSSCRGSVTASILHLFILAQSGVYRCVWRWGLNKVTSLCVCACVRACVRACVHRPRPTSAPQQTLKKLSCCWSVEGMMPPCCGPTSPLICSPQTLSPGVRTTATVIIIRAGLQLLLFCCIRICVCVCVHVCECVCVCGHVVFELVV